MNRQCAISPLSLSDPFFELGELAADPPYLLSHVVCIYIYIYIYLIRRVTIDADGANRPARPMDLVVRLSLLLCYFSMEIGSVMMMAFLASTRSG